MPFATITPRRISGLDYGVIALYFAVAFGIG